MTTSAHKGYFPADTVSAELLKSIPKKVYHWLEGILPEMTEPGEFQELKWNLTEDQNTLIFGEEDTLEYCVIWWEGSADEPMNLCTSSPLLESVIDNLDFFTQLEENIYSTLESFEEEDERARKY